MIHSYRDLLVWQKSVELVSNIYKITEKYPKAEIFGLVSQMRRAAVSIPSNIAEGRHRGTRKDFLNFLRTAYGSCAELATQLEISKRLKYVEERNEKFLEILKSLEEIMKMLGSMISKLNPVLVKA